MLIVTKPARKKIAVAANALIKQVLLIVAAEANIFAAIANVSCGH